MTPHETALVTILLERLKNVDAVPKDPEAETLIRESTADQPNATYHLVQTVLIQDLSWRAPRRSAIAVYHRKNPVAHFPFNVAPSMRPGSEVKHNGPSPNPV